MKYLNGAEIVLSGGSDEPKINTITEEVLHELLLISAPVAFHNTYISHSFLIISWVYLHLYTSLHSSLITSWIYHNLFGPGLRSGE